MQTEQERREGLKSLVRESEFGRIVDEHAGDLVIMPAQMFDEEEIPDVELAPFLVEFEDEARVPIPRYLPEAFSGGLHLIAPHHIAMMWYDMRAEVLREEVKLRKENGLPIPPIAEQRLEREVYR
ncbi:hypothetical protein DJ68_14610 [Halorubrum sp. C3]|nr:hypothetical protein DJ68_14610 [Halorubrum sp. C3]